MADAQFKWWLAGVNEPKDSLHAESYTMHVYMVLHLQYYLFGLNDIPTSLCHASGHGMAGWWRGCWKMSTLGWWMIQSWDSRCTRSVCMQGRVGGGIHQDGE